MQDLESQGVGENRLLERLWKTWAKEKPACQDARITVAKDRLHKGIKV